MAFKGKEYAKEVGLHSSFIFTAVSIKQIGVQM